MTIFYEKYLPLEKKIFNNKRYRLNCSENLEIAKIFKKANILVMGACGSIGFPITNEIINYDFNKIYLIDKNENSLTELNREIILKSNKSKIKKINYICCDLTHLDIDKLIKNEKISHYLNLAAVKHVRSEEDINSLKYMFRTNSDSFLPKNKHRHLKIIFSVSSDKAVYPSSMLGVSKLLMEKKLMSYKLKNNSTNICCARFANVSFSNGSILKFVADRLDQRKVFGIPKNIRRYFITHKEAKNLCLKSMLKKYQNKIIVPSHRSLGKDFLIKDLVDIIAKIKKKKINYTYKFDKNLKSNVVVLTDSNFVGQKPEEMLYYEEEITKINENDDIVAIEFISSLPVQKLLNKIYKLKSINLIKKYVLKNISSYKYLKRKKKLSQSI